jgi:hypothetical protein
MQFLKTGNLSLIFVRIQRTALITSIQEGTLIAAERRGEPLLSGKKLFTPQYSLSFSQLSLLPLAGTLLQAAHSPVRQHQLQSQNEHHSGSG